MFNANALSLEDECTFNGRSVSEDVGDGTWCCVKGASQTERDTKAP